MNSQENGAVYCDPPPPLSSIIVLFGTLCKNALPKLDFMRQQKNYHRMHIASSPLLPLPRPLALFTCIFSYTCLCVCVRFRRGAAQKQNNNKKACNFLAVVPLLVCVFVGLSLVLFFLHIRSHVCVCVGCSYFFGKCCCLKVNFTTHKLQKCVFLIPLKKAFLLRL